MNLSLLTRVLPITVGAAVVVIGAIRADVAMVTVGVGLLGAPGAAALAEQPPQIPDDDEGTLDE